ncbi:hypothetical protein B0H16DRAFT_1747454 [Mycena metata]|uniref:Uncharacterized protein n=1 Tax=Mycena metata TaxID=1033252 RepID=A0AAD7GTV7_9AGAR|nr:hypothetical protein B0H16DRAFT_1747454 [Mycena metata]
MAQYASPSKSFVSGNQMRLSWTAGSISSQNLPRFLCPPLHTEKKNPYKPSMSRLPSGARRPPNPPITPRSTRRNPILVDSSGNIVRSLSTTPPTTRVDENTPIVVAVCRDARGEITCPHLPGVGHPRSPSGHALQIHSGPPSEIMWSVPTVPYPSDCRLPSMRAARDNANDRHLPSIRAARDNANDRPYLHALARSTHGPTPAFAAAAQRYGYAGGPSPSVQRQPDSAPFIPGIRLRRHKPGTGHRTARVKGMSENNLYLMDERPPVAGRMHAHYECTALVVTPIVTSVCIYGFNASGAVPIAVRLYSTVSGTHWLSMPPGRPLLDPETKTSRRREALQRYAEKYSIYILFYLLSITQLARNREALRESACVRMQQ